ncbi:MAG: hypothetical protein E5Y63_29480 [Mesorhizobium sp.]|uniref:hypothetical protein n=1 Tax=Mesorhizobium sp. TaxID=1871066 RepID=UPI000FE54F73|nr:hypothetical protein [Mesorhizobium sp.]RWP23110.1 MAG: hypothetical protein EOR02_32915 [Mesorhizobium sp.]TIM26411.1 MAG: hypothetical protein E5Y63_29480 [Mesorhizobium sp.]
MQPEGETMQPKARTEIGTVAPLVPTNAMVRRLFSEMERRGLRYCHWKSSIRLEDALSGDDDIDLLVDRRDAPSFYAAIVAIGFKLAVSRTGIGHPGVFHAFALDEETARLVHLHAYFQIVSGDSLVKTYRFPIESDLLEHTRFLYGVRVPAAEAELVLFVIRIALKHAGIVETLLVSRDYHTVSRELAWLQAQCDMAITQSLCAAWFPGVNKDVFAGLMGAIADERAVLRRVWLGRKVARALKDLRRLSAPAAAANRAKRLCGLAFARFRRRKDLALHSGGAIVALVGPKAVGKSTLGSALSIGLGEHLDVCRIHAGKPPASGATFAIRLLVPVARRLFPQERPGEYEKSARRQAKHYSMLYVLRMAVLAYDRRRLLRKALRSATAGTIVICDRYPSTTVGAIDSMQFDADAHNNCNSATKRRLMDLERKLGEDVPPANLIIRLVAPLATSIRRDAGRNKQGGPDADAVERRRSLEMHAEFGSTPVVHIDTEQPLDESIRAVMRAVWCAL